MIPEVETLALLPETMFYVMGLERIMKGASITASDRNECLRIAVELRKRAREFVETETPQKFLPEYPPLEEVRDCLAGTIDTSEWKYADTTALLEAAARARGYLAKLAPPFLSSDVFPVDLWPSALDHGDLIRGYALLCRPGSIWGLLEMGGLQQDEVEAFATAMPQLFEGLASTVFAQAVNKRINTPTWIPSPVVAEGMGILQGNVSAAPPVVQEMFGLASKAAAKSSAQPKSQQGDATPVQKRQAGEGSP